MFINNKLVLVNMKKVQVWVGIAGDYCAFHEVSLSIKYDITNDIQLDDMSLEELNDHEYEDYSDYEIRDAYLIKGKYYVDWE
jgi:hypothetical protein